MERKILPKSGWLERMTSAVLLVVLAALGWMVTVAHWPEMGRIARVEFEVAAMLMLLGAALCLVSLVALLHTRR